MAFCEILQADCPVEDAIPVIDAAADITGDPHSSAEAPDRFKEEALERRIAVARAHCGRFCGHVVVQTAEAVLGGITQEYVHNLRATSGGDQ